MLGAAGYHAIGLSGLQLKDTAEISSLHNAIVLAEDQRVWHSLHCPDLKAVSEHCT